MKQIFISYKSEYRDFAKKVRDTLQSWGYTTWFDQDDIPEGAYFRHEIQKGLNSSDAIVGIMTEEAFSSREVMWEWDYGIYKSRLIPVRYHNCELPYHLQGTQYIDFVADIKHGFEQLKEALINPASTIAKRTELESQPKTDSTNRSNMLELVRRTWIEGVLEKSLHDNAMIELGVAAKADAVLTHRRYGDYELPSSAAIIDIFNDMNRELLILGDPGAGKTFTMLQLASALITQAENDASLPIPIVFNLSSWAVERTPLNTWLIDQLRTQYYVQKKIATQWVENGMILPLLDGLDEVAEEYRDDCVVVINGFRKTYSFVDLVVCSRIKDYDRLTNRLNFDGAITLQPLSSKQVEHYLQGDNLEGIRAVYAKDTILQRLAQSPFLLNTMRFAYADMSERQLSGYENDDSRRDHLLDKYIDKRLQDNPNPEYTLKQTRHYLTWLANSMFKHEKTVFYLEDIQPDWLTTKKQKQSYRIRVIFKPTALLWLPFSLLMGIMAFSLFLPYLGADNTNILIGLCLGLMALPIVTIVIELLLVLLSIIPYGMFLLEKGKIADATNWSWKRSISHGVGGFILFSVMIEVLASYLINQPSNTLGISVGVGIVTGISGGMREGWMPKEMQTRATPNQGIRNSIIHCLRTNAPPVLIFSLFIGGILNSIMGGSVIYILIGVIFIFSLTTFLFGMTTNKVGRFVIQHYTLRHMLKNYGHIPANYINFLDYASECTLLRKVGGGYVFIHRYLLEYFAGLEAEKEGD